MRRITAVAMLLFLGGCAGAPRPNSAPAVFYPPAPAPPRVQFLTQLSNSAQVAGERSSLSRMLFGGQQQAEEIIKPYGVACSGGSVYACDTKRGLILIFDLENRRFGHMGGLDNGALKKPINLFAAPNGDKFVADADGRCIAVYSSADAYLKSFGHGELQRPVDVAADDTRIFVCDAESCLIQVYDRATLAHLYEFGGKGSSDGRFARPTNIAVDDSGHVYVSDTINGRVQKLDADGNHLQTIGSLGDRPGQMARPKGLDVDPAGRLYVADAAFENIQIFDDTGRLLLFFGGPGQEDGQLTLPADVTLDTEHIDYFRDFIDDDFEVEYLILVTSQYGPNKVNVYGFGQDRYGE